MSIRYRYSSVLTDTSTSNRYKTNPIWTSSEDTFAFESVDLDTSETVLSYGSVSSPKLLRLSHISGGLVEVSPDNGATYPFSLARPDTTVDGDTMTVRINVESLRETTDVTCEADVSGSLGGDYIQLYDRNGIVWAWFDVDNGSTAPTVTTERLIEVDIAQNATASEVATALAAALEADEEFSATAASAVVTIVDQHIGTRTDATAGTTGWTTISITQQGAAAPIFKAKSENESVLSVMVVPN